MYLQLLNAPIMSMAWRLHLPQRCQPFQNVKAGMEADHLLLPACAGEDVMSLMQKGGEVRRVGETNMNRESSRSHAVFTAVVEVATTQESGLTNVRYSRINLIDLAGV